MYHESVNNSKEKKHICKNVEHHRHPNKFFFRKSKQDFTILFELLNYREKYHERCYSSWLWKIINYSWKGSNFGKSNKSTLHHSFEPWTKTTKNAIFFWFHPIIGILMNVEKKIHRVHINVRIMDFIFFFSLKIYFALNHHTRKKKTWRNVFKIFQIVVFVRKK